MAAYDSDFDCRERESGGTAALASKIRQHLTMREGLTTRQIADLVGCSMPQARRALEHLQSHGEAIGEGTTRARIWLATY